MSVPSVSRSRYSKQAARQSLGVSVDINSVIKCLLTMRLLLPAFVGIVFGTVEAIPVEYYASKYDHIDVETILNNRRMINYYVDCMLSKGPCPPEGLEFKRILPEALRTNCERCTEKQKTVTLRAIRRLRKEYPKVWAQLATQWDPDGSYVEKFEATFNTRPTESTPQESINILNRFGTEATTGNAIDNSISQIYTSSTAPSSTKPTSKITATRVSSTKAPTTSSAVSTTGKISAKVATKKLTTTSTTKASAKVTTNKPAINISAAPTKTTKRPRPNIAASIQATVSSGPQIIGDLVRGLGALGTRVVETGAQIAGVVLKNIARPL